MSENSKSINMSTIIPILGIMAMILSFLLPSVIDVEERSLYLRLGCYISIGAGIAGLLMSIISSRARRFGLILSAIAIALGVGLLELGVPADLPSEIQAD